MTTTRGMTIGKEITAASLHARAQCTCVSYIRHVQRYQSMSCVTIDSVRAGRSRIGCLRHVPTCTLSASAVGPCVDRQLGLRVVR